MSCNPTVSSTDNLPIGHLSSPTMILLTLEAMLHLVFLSERERKLKFDLGHLGGNVCD